MCSNIVLIGFMGSGKSSVGRRLAAKQKYQFLDTDHEIVAIAGISINKIFATEGEKAFRNRETALLHHLVSHNKIVLATGGGIILREENCNLLKQIGTIFWLFAKPDILFERAMRSHKRPLLQGENPRENFDLHLTERESLYRKVADFQVDVSYLNHEEIAQQILGMLHHKNKLN